MQLRVDISEEWVRVLVVDGDTETLIARVPINTASTDMFFRVGVDKLRVRQYPGGGVVGYLARNKIVRVAAREFDEAGYIWRLITDGSLDGGYVAERSRDGSTVFMNEV